MAQTKTIVAATDLSRSALDAARRAAIARDQGARLALLHVIPHPFVSDSWNQVLIELKLDERHFREAAMQQLREQAERTRADTSVIAEIHVAEGKPFAEIAARALALKAALLVVGAHGENALLDPFLGTTAHRVLRFARVPVLLVKLSPSFAYERAVIATDFSDDSAEAARCARRIFKRLDMTLFHARTRSRSKASSHTQECPWKLSSATGIVPKRTPAGISLRLRERSNSTRPYRPFGADRPLCVSAK